MKTFDEYMNEMATHMGHSPKGIFSKKELFNDIKNSLILIKDKLPGGYSVLKNESDYYLTKNDDYMGHIEYIRTGSVISINHSHSEIKRGFYELIFSSILSDRLGSIGSIEILSDLSLSTQAIKSYENLNRSVSIFELAVKIGKTYHKYSTELLLSSRRAKVSIKSKHNITEVFDEYYKKLETGLYRMDKSKTNGLFGYTLFHEGWDKV